MDRELLRPQRFSGYSSTHDQSALTRREWEIATLASHGNSSRLIAEKLHISVRTVDTHLLRVYKKVGVTGREQLAAALGC
jgi:DNA-binding CsgD family transcriptional regulator